MMLLLRRSRRGGRLPAAAAIHQLFITNRSTSASSSKLFVGGLSYDTNETALKDAFSQHGHVIQVKVVCHPTTGKSKGYGFVSFSSEEAAAAALQKMNGEVLDERNIRVQYANKDH